MKENNTYLIHEDNEQPARCSSVPLAGSQCIKASRMSSRRTIPVPHTNSQNMSPNDKIAVNDYFILENWRNMH